MFIVIGKFILFHYSFNFVTFGLEYVELDPLLNLFPMGFVGSTTSTLLLAIFIHNIVGD